jgi:hypothetical protein
MAKRKWDARDDRDPAGRASSFTRTPRFLRLSPEWPPGREIFASDVFWYDLGGGISCERKREWVSKVRAGGVMGGVPVDDGLAEWQAMLVQAAPGSCAAICDTCDMFTVSKGSRTYHKFPDQTSQSLAYCGWDITFWGKTNAGCVIQIGTGHVIIFSRVWPCRQTKPARISRRRADPDPSAPPLHMLQDSCKFHQAV